MVIHTTSPRTSQQSFLVPTTSRKESTRPQTPARPSSPSFLLTLLRALAAPAA